jgi:hypothetical protein
MIERRGQHLFGRHVIRRPNDLPSRRDLGTLAAFPQFRQSEVQNLRVHGPRAAGYDEDVLGLEIPMNDARFMGFSQRRANLDEQTSRLIEGERTIALDDGREIVTLEVLHD